MEKNEVLDAFSFYLNQMDVKRQFDRDAHKSIVKFTETGEEKCLGCWLTEIEFH